MNSQNGRRLTRGDIVEVEWLESGPYPLFHYRCCRLSLSTENALFKLPVSLLIGVTMGGASLEGQRINKIDGNSKSIRELLNGVKYSIDYYQREFKWKPVHVTELIHDLEAKFLENYDDQHDRSRVQEYSNYFLGSVVISKKKGKNFIIDGQQRLTCITLLLIHLNNMQRDAAQKVDVKGLIFSEKYGRRSFNIEVDERIACMDALYNGNRLDLLENKSESVRNIVGRYEDIQNFFPDSLKGKVLPYFLDWLIDNVIMVEIVTYSDDDAYTIFETMNDRGLSLSPTDMLKGYLLTNIEDQETKSKANELWKRRVLEMNELGKEEAHGFFKAWLRAKYAETIRERKKGASNKDFETIGTSFHKWVRDEKEKIGLDSSSAFADFIFNKFDLYSRIYVKIRKAANSLTPGLENVYYNDHNNFTLQDHLILAAINPDDDETTIEKKMGLVSRFIDMFVVRRFINYRTLGYSSIQYTIFNLMRELRNEDLHSLASTLKKKVEEMEEKLDALLDFSLHSQNGTYVHYLLARITHYVENESNVESDFVKFVSKDIKKPYEIEHIWAKVYAYHKDEFPQEHEFLEYRNRIGGLLLLPEDFNQSYNDAPYDLKLQHYDSQNLLSRSLGEKCYQNNPSFLKFIQSNGLPFRPHQEFKKADLDLRQDLYLRICRMIWDPKRLET
ncbi:MAG: DUF262 domain-containing protein [Thermoplasmatota archaeon]